MLRLQRPVKGLRTADWRLTQGYGGDYYVNGRLVYGSMGYPGHFGLDYAGRSPGMKIPVYATESGWCYLKYSSTGYGNHIKFYFEQDGQKYRCVYGHLDSFSVAHKQWVKKGDQIGIMGTTGFSSGVHLHFDIVRCTDTWGVIDTLDGYKGFFDPTNYIVNWEEPFTEEQKGRLETEIRLNSRFRERINDSELRDKWTEMNDLIRSKIS